MRGPGLPLAVVFVRLLTIEGREPQPVSFLGRHLGFRHSPVPGEHAKAWELITSIVLALPPALPASSTNSASMSLSSIDRQREGFILVGKNPIL